jgi:hypothetical protein
MVFVFMYSQLLISEGDWLGGYGVDPVGSEYGPMTVSCKYGDEPAGSGAMELVSGFCT